MDPPPSEPKTDKEKVKQTRGRSPGPSPQLQHAVTTSTLQIPAGTHALFAADSRLSPRSARSPHRSVSPRDDRNAKEKKEKKAAKEVERSKSPLHRSSDESPTRSSADLNITSSILTSASARLEGWLSKQTATYTYSAKAGWRPRYFILRHGCLFWYKMTPAVSLPRFELDNCAVTVPSAAAMPLFSSKFGYQLSLTNSDGENVLMAFESAVEQQSWNTIFQRFKPSSEEADGIKKRGWVYRYSKSWKLRYVILRHSQLEFFESSEKGFWPLLHNTLDTPKDEPSVFMLMSERGKRLPLKAGDGRLLASWLEALREDLESLSKEAGPPSSAATVELVAGQDSSPVSLPVNPLTAMSRKVMAGKPDVGMIKLLGRVRDTLQQDKRAHEEVMKQRALKQEAHILDAPRFHRKRQLNILSFDGGGLRGIMGCIILERLRAEFPDLLDRFQVVAGCSNGAMLAMGLAFGVQPSGCRTLLEVTGESIFNINSWITTPIKTCKFQNQPLKLLCDEVWGTKKLSDAEKYVLIPSFLLDNQNADPTKREWRIALHHNFNPEEPSTNDLASDVVMRSAAAPTYFPSYQRHVDGGVWAHDPSSSAVLLAVTRLRKKAKKINLLSIGTGKVLHHIDADPDIQWGMYQYLPHLTSLLWDGMIQRSENDCRELLGARYCRVNPLLEKEIQMDNPAVMPVLTKVAYEVDLKSTIAWIRTTLYDGQSP